MNGMKKRKKVGLALGGGGAKGLAHIGVIQALVEAGVKISAVAGTSMGALVGGWYASGKDISALQNLFLGVRKKDITPIAKMVHKKDTGLFRDASVSTVLKDYLKGVSIEKCPIPFAAIATNVKDGGEEVLISGNLEDAIRASTALPIVFQPVKLKGELMIDGGFVNPVPADIVKKMGVDCVIAVDVSSKWVDFSSESVSLSHLRELIPKTLMIIEYQIGRRILERADIVLHPPVLGYSWHDFSEAKEIIRAGYEETKGRMKEILTMTGTPTRKKSPTEKLLGFLFYSD